MGSWAANCQTLQMQLLCWPLKKRHLPPKALPTCSLNRTKIFHCLTKKSSKCQELTQTQLQRSYLNCLPTDWVHLWFVNFLHPSVMSLAVWFVLRPILCAVLRSQVQPHGEISLSLGSWTCFIILINFALCLNKTDVVERHNSCVCLCSMLRTLT